MADTATRFTRPLSPLDGIRVIEDFICNDAADDATVGQLDWELDAITTADVESYVTGQSGAAGIGVTNGVLRLTGAGAADGTGSSFRSFTDGLVINQGAGGFSFRVRYPEITGNALAGNNFRIGLDDSVTATAPGSGITVASDAGVITCTAWSNDHGDVTITPTAAPTLTSGTTMTLDVWNTFRVEWDGDNGQGGPRLFYLYVDGFLAGQDFLTLDDDEEVELKIVHWQDTGGAASLELDLDFFEYWQWIDRETP